MKLTPHKEDQDNTRVYRPEYIEPIEQTDPITKKKYSELSQKEQISMNKYGNAQGRPTEEPLELVSPEFEVLTVGRGLWTNLGKSIGKGTFSKLPSNIKPNFKGNHLKLAKERLKNGGFDKLGIDESEISLTNKLRKVVKTDNKRNILLDSKAKFPRKVETGGPKYSVDQATYYSPYSKQHPELKVINRNQSIDSHEFYHMVDDFRVRSNKDPMAFKRLPPAEPPGYTAPTDTRLDSYLRQLDGTELKTRGIQIKNYFGLNDARQDITPSMWNYAKKHYATDTGLSNIEQVFNAVTDPKTYLQWLNPRIAVGAGVAGLVSKNAKGGKVVKSQLVKNAERLNGVRRDMRKKFMKSTTPTSDIKRVKKSQMGGTINKNMFALYNTLERPTVSTPKSFVSAEIEAPKVEDKKLQVMKEANKEKKSGNDVSINIPTSTTKPTPITNSKSKTSARFMGNKEFIAKMGAAYDKVLRERGIDSKYRDYLVAQSALESGWGKSQSGINNLGGIKVSNKDKGKGLGTIRRTREVINGKDQYINDEFRNFNSLEDYARYHVNLLAGRRYNAFNGDFIKNVVGGGYATDPKYSSILEDVYKQVVS